MSATDEIHGGDAVVRITTYQLGTTTPVDLTQFVAFGITINIDNVVIQKYCSATVSGYKPTIAVSLAAGVFDINIFREDLYGKRNGMITGQVFGYTSDADFLDDKKELVGKPCDITAWSGNSRILSTKLGY